MRSSRSVATAAGPRTARLFWLSVGFSNTTMEAQAFAKVVAAAPGVNPHFVFVDDAQGAQAASQAANPDSQLLASQ